MTSATSELLAWETPPSKDWAIECNLKFFIRFSDRKLAENFARGYAYAMRQRDFECSWAQYDIRCPGFKRGADFATKMRLWSRRWGLDERWNPTLYKVENSKLKKVRGF